MRRALLTTAAVAAATWGGWQAYVRAQGDSEVAFDGDGLSSITGDGRTIHGEITLRNRGKAGAVVHKVEGRVIAGATGRVLVTRKDSRSPDRGWWRSNCLLTGETCVAEVDVELDPPAKGPITIELDAHDIGRRPVVHRTIRLVVPIPLGGSEPGARSEAAPTSRTASTPAT